MYEEALMTRLRTAVVRRVEGVAVSQQAIGTSRVKALVACLVACWALFESRLQHFKQCCGGHPKRAVHSPKATGR